MEGLLQEIYEGILEGDRATVKDKVNESLASGQSPETVLNAMIERWEKLAVCLKRANIMSLKC